MNKHHTTPLLERAEIEINLQAPLAVTHYRLCFDNTGKETVEALFHFTLARMACLMHATLKLNGRDYQGEVMAKAAANERYEEAIDEGKKSLLLESIGDGLYQINLGNLEPGDTATLELQIASWLTPQPGGWQYRLLTVIAAKYGQTQAASAPTNSVLACYPFIGRLHCQGLAKPVHASHALREEDGCFAFKGELDRDILFSLPASPLSSQLLSASWQGARYSLGYINAEAPSKTVQNAVLHVLLDCSGSMQGDSIEQVRRALLTLLEQADEQLHLNLYRFGSRFEAYGRHPLPCDKRHKQNLRDYVQSMQADMGGTEIIQALNALVMHANHPGPQQVLMITDGQVYVQDEQVAALQARCQQQQCTLHALGVGHAADEILLSRLTGEAGQLMLVNPVEPVGSVITDLLQQLRQPTQAVQASWQPKPTWQKTPRLQFGNTPVMVAASHPVNSLPRLDCQIGEEKKQLQATALTEPLWTQALVQLAASQQLPSQPLQQQADLAVQMQLITDHTSFVLVTDKQVKHPERYPTIQEIAQMRGFDGAVMGRMASYDVDQPQVDCLDMPAFLRRSSRADHNELYSLIPDQPAAPKVVVKLHRRLTRRFFRHDLPDLAQLQEWGIHAPALLTLQAESTTYPEQGKALMALWLSLLFSRFSLPVPGNVQAILQARPQLNISSVRDAMQTDIEQLINENSSTGHALAD
ncbi:VIT and vWA domain-containing protein [Bowmanella dokdonensis]|uniref:VWA domain-containing protein n=1 Tax=Bowmanella dokdonensis TaxID=751969 RepID=A0A939IR60_9ALTE|nr:VIT and VWA domain-containing protein [Bowmanella dokdonensis]MBN7825779.1 VWA domain-containing protein [Bowmanella dokdonensis]